ncbi:DNA polymerase III subunit alpha [Acidisoma silvae]|uniref:DNA polymerase III subunit alpha n=1 Tax=Acidisoma silvae TaxID=2802396 RepID=A0A963YT68_9PROT|nr:DNA polymerase III subunit alpha [Acidisoma silvae]MCB8876506.1 DNA polymerase III subunit alpha [Acidisoma silvae]
MTAKSFVHLHAHSAYSLSEGAIKVDKLIALAAGDGMPALALTDSSNMFGALEFAQYATGKGLQPIMGCQIGLARADLPRLPPDPIVVLAQTEAGFANLQRLSSVTYLETETGLKPQVSFERLAELSEGLFLLTGGTFGPINRLLAEGQRAEAARLLAQFAELFPDRMAVELHRHGLSIEKAIEPGILALADEIGLPIVAANDCYFANASMHQAHDALLCIAEGRVLSEADRRHVTPEHWFKPAAVMRELFADLPEACDNTLAIARRCAVMAESRKPLLPVCPKVQEGMTEEETVRAMAHTGLDQYIAREKMDDDKANIYKERLDFELGVIARMGFPGYFMIVADFIQWAKARDIPVGPGRGSGAGSLVAFALSITALDPLRFSLLFERFLNPERVSMPDFDIDFCQDRRDEVISYVRGEYGSDRVAQIITYGKLQARAAVRDVGRVLGLPFGQVNRVAELIPNNPAKPVTLKEAVDGEPKLQQMRDEDESVRRLLEIALQLEGLYRHASTHAAGVVIGDRPLTELVPLYKDPRSDFLVTQYSMKHVEQAGLVKFDFLGLTTLTIIRRAITFLKGLDIEVDIDALPLDDAPTYEMLARGDAGGVFQFESQGMRDVLRQMRPDRFEDLIAAVALYRPGPMANIPAYCQRKHGEAWEPPHPDIHDVLSETYGIMVYQEQVMQIAQKLGGYSLGGADLLRRAMGKKIRAEMEKQREIFTTGALAQGIDDAKAGEIFDLMAKFADYGFNKSHAAAYALVAYQTAWMKANHPVPFIAACMSLAISNTDKLAAFRQEANRMGITILPPDINKSGADFTVERLPDGKLAIRYALAAVKRVGQAAMEAVTAARGKKAFDSLAEFSERVDPKLLNKMQLENLIKAGAFDHIDNNRARLFAGAEILLKRAQATAEDRGSGQIGLFGGADAKPEPLRLPDLLDWPMLDRLGFEAEAIGFHLTSHPLDSFGSTLKRLGVTISARLQTAAESGVGRVKVAGIVVGSPKVRPTKTGGRMAWLRLSDGGGSFEVTMFSEVLSRSQEFLREGMALLVTVDLRMDGDALRITAQDVTSLEKAAAGAGVGMRVWLSETSAVDHIRALLMQEGTGRGEVILHPRLDAAREAEIRLPGRFNVSPRLAAALKVMPGISAVEEI